MLKRIIIGIPILTLVTAVGLGLRHFASGVTVWHPETKVFDSTAQDDTYFGTAVAVEGDNIVVGATDYHVGNAKAGAAFVYTRSGSTWVEEAKLLCDNIRYGCLRFGQSVAISGDTIAVSTPHGSGYARRPDSNGVVYVFTRAGNTWVQQTKLVPPDDSRINFADVVDIDGHTLVAGDDGAAYIYVRNPATGSWSFQAKLLPKEEDLIFGPAVAIEGNTIVVGRGEDGGSVDVFSRSVGTNTWQHQAELLPQEPIRGRIAFGHAVAIDQGRILVGASSERSIIDLYPVGAAHLYEQDSQTEKWMHRARLLPQGMERGTFPYGFGSPSPYGFGSSVAISGDVAVVGARSVRWPVPSSQSAAFVYRLDEKTGQWKQQAKIDPQLEVGYINSVAVSERYIVVGDTVATGKSNKVGEGAAYVFDVQESKL